MGEEWSQAPEWLPRAIAGKLREADREASLRGCSDTGFPRLWFSAIWRSARLDFLGTLRETGRHPNDSSILSRADRAFHSPALFEAREQSLELQQEVKRLAAEIDRLTAEAERHRMTEEERRASKYASAYFRRGGYPDTAAADAIRGYLDRTAPEEVGRE